MVAVSLKKKALLVYRRVLSLRERLQVVLVTATALPLLVALSEIGLRNGTMLPDISGEELEQWLENLKPEDFGKLDS